MEEGYDIAQICLNGHVVNDSVRSFPEHSKNFCDKCGAKTITNCPNCDSEVQGYYLVSGVISPGYDFKAPGFCHNCGKPYPWTEQKIHAAQELAQEIENLSEDEKKILTQSIDDIVKDSPKTPLATTRFKRIVSKAGKEVAGALRDILVDIASEAARKTLWPK